MEEEGAVYASDPWMRPDEEFEPGELRHLVAGARGRMLDPRRTPVSVVGVRTSTGFADIRVEGFEDDGAIWEIPLEQAGQFQFEMGGSVATAADLAEMERAIERLSGEQAITAQPPALERTGARISGLMAHAADWLGSHSRFVREGRALPCPSTRRGDPILAEDLRGWLEERDLWDVEEAFARTFVSNPGSGEIVKGHRIVLAELGLADYAGAVVRDPATFEGAWSRQRRAQHILARLAFVRALFGRLGLRSVELWRGAAIEGQLRARMGRTFVSTSFDEAVARSHFQNGAADWTHVLVRQDVPTGHVFMTYHETAAMNTVFLEAEAVVLARPHDGWP
jgi:hypothetical protein